MNMISLISITFFLLAALDIGLAKRECKEDELRDCLSSLQHSVMQHFHDLQKINKDKYCRDVNSGKQCLDDAMDNCFDEHTQMSHLIYSFYSYLNQICSEKGKIYMDIAPCLAHHESEFKKCKMDDGQDGNPMEEICRETDYLKCVAEVSKKVCENGEEFGKNLEEHISKLRMNVCSTAGTIRINYWMLIAAIIGLFLTKMKI